MEKLCFSGDSSVAFRPGKIGEFHDENASLQLYTSFFYDTVRKKYRPYHENRRVRKHRGPLPFAGKLNLVGTRRGFNDPRSASAAF